MLPREKTTIKLVQQNRALLRELILRIFSTNFAVEEAVVEQTLTHKTWSLCFKIFLGWVVVKRVEDGIVRVSLLRISI
jgi:hypothetical protein